jgi:hypothetical protein
MKKTTLIITIIIALLAVSGGSFYGGTIFGKSQNTRPSFNSANFQGARTGRTGASMISGGIISSDSSSITLQLPDNGGSKIVFYSDATQISKMASGTADDLAKGISVSVAGTTNSDGSITAQSIQVRPAGQNRSNP